ncbi:uncharacterized protein METZ01_LOCUS301797, partial [marine metagenome]
MDFAPVGQSGCYHVLGCPPSIVRSRAVYLRWVLAAERT